MRALRPILLVRVGGLKVTRIGHFATNTELYLCERDEGLRGRSFDLFSLPSNVSDEQLATMWCRVLRIYPFVRYISRASSFLPGHRAHTIVLPSDLDARGFLNRTTPHLQFTEEEESLGRERLRNTGVPEGSPFVCIYSRDLAYLASAIPDGEWRYHDYRDADIQSYMQAAEELSARGYYVLRMGAAVSEPFTTDDPRIIDYAVTHRDEFMDVYLSANCRIFLGPAAGIYAVARIFQRPIAYVNYIPLSNAATWSGQGLLIPKTLRMRGSNHPISIPEMMELGAVSFNKSEEYEELDIEVVNNSPEEIAAVALELDDRLTDFWKAERDDEHLQQMFWSALGVPSDEESVHARAGADFLRGNQALLQHLSSPSSANKVYRWRT